MSGPGGNLFGELFHVGKQLFRQFMTVDQQRCFMVVAQGRVGQVVAAEQAEMAVDDGNFCVGGCFFFVKGDADSVLPEQICSVPVFFLYVFVVISFLQNHLSLDASFMGDRQFFYDMPGAVVFPLICLEDKGGDVDLLLGGADQVGEGFVILAVCQ